MPLFRPRKEEEKKPALDELRDSFVYDDLESVTRDLPTGEAKEEPAAEVPETPEEDGAIPEAEVLGQQASRTAGKRSTRKRHRFNQSRQRRERSAGRVRKLFLGTVTVVILLFIGLMILARIMPNVAILRMPENALAGIVTPVQNVISAATEGLGGFFRSWKLRANIEEEYNKVVAQNEELVYAAMRADELEAQLAQFKDMYEEMAANSNMNPIVCSVTGRSDGNYFDTFTISRGSRDGIGRYMAVTISGALVGYTEDVSETETHVRTIIDSEASIAGLIQSSRDQGTVRGTLGIDGTAMCRMYYLPDDHLPRPGDKVVTSGVGMSFPKGIPIGTVRESTRGMAANKQYIVVEPIVDFEHLEYVIVLRYQPEALSVQGRESNNDRGFIPLETARPYPTLRIGSTSYFGETPTPDPLEGAQLEADPYVTFTPGPTDTPTPRPTEPPAGDPAFEYHAVNGEPTPSPTASPTPSPTPFITLSPDQMTWEEDG